MQVRNISDSSNSVVMRQFVELTSLDQATMTRRLAEGNLSLAKAFYSHRKVNNLSLSSNNVPS